MPIQFTCPHCGQETFVADQYVGRSGPCAGCGRTITILLEDSPSADLGDNAAMRMLLPVGRSGWAIAAGYAGLFSVLFVPAPIALILAILAIRDLRRHREKHGMGRAIFGLVMGGIFSLALAVGLIAWIVDSFTPRR